jgi:hypothetical protein
MIDNSNATQCWAAANAVADIVDSGFSEGRALLQAVGVEFFLLSTSNQDASETSGL